MNSSLVLSVPSPYHIKPNSFQKLHNEFISKEYYVRTEIIILDALIRKYWLVPGNIFNMVLFILIRCNLMLDLFSSRCHIYLFPRHMTFCLLLKISYDWLNSILFLYLIIDFRHLSKKIYLVEFLVMQPFELLVSSV